MAAHASGTQSADPIEATHPVAAVPAPVQRSGTELAICAPAGRKQRPAPSVADGVRAAAAVMGWAIWIMLALTMAAFLAFAPSLI